MKQFLSLPQLICVFATLACALSSQAVSVTNNLARIAAHHASAQHHSRSVTDGDGRSVEDEETDKYFPILISITDESAIDKLTEIGTIIYHRRDNILLACVPMEYVDKLLPDYGVCRAEMSTCIIPSLDHARAATGVDVVHGSQFLPQLGTAIDGTGVIAGFTDTGFDARHPAFENRIGMISHYDACNGTHLSAYTPAEISGWITDTDEERHASHVCGIMAGGYRGNNVYGVAPGATIAASTSMLTDVGILAGIEDIIAYAKSAGKPAVINMSLSSNAGPHDGTDLFSRYLDKCAEDAVIVMSAGNAGDRYVHHRKTFTETDKEIYVAYDYRFDSYKTRGVVDVWSVDERPFSVRLAILDDSEPAYVHITEALTVDPSAPTQLIIDGESDPEWSKYFNGYAVIAGEVNEANGRANITISLQHDSWEKSLNGNWARYYTVAIVEGAPGVTTDMYADYGNLRFRRFPKVPVPDSDMSISSIACGFNTISVGATANRNSLTNLDGTQRNFDITEGEIGLFTSYGELSDGRTLPHIAAPGQVVISCASRPYALAHPDDYEPFTHCAVKDGEEYYWIQNSGTSMSSPHVAGVVALMLQVDPTLTSTQVRDILRETANTQVPDADNIRWGAGMVDAAAAVNRVYSMSSLPSIDSTPAVSITLNGHHIDIASTAAIDGCNAELYGINGILADTGSFNSGVHTTLTAPAKGVYIVKVGSYIKKIVVK